MRGQLRRQETFVVLTVFLHKEAGDKRGGQVRRQVTGEDSGGERRHD